ncbi:hypothetical protein GCM10009665_16480 [Kitasatospora nipponensis]|uniref:Uncharacterized protein n=1 Tax=Kitasatospora nipponensis TaxID=258049 RepID=A0ABN1VXP3_9ACTN
MPIARHYRTLLVALALASLTTACGGSDDNGRFDAQSATPSPTCQQHQSRQPGTQYTGKEKSDPTSVLEMMRYYTANGIKPYCDGKPATATDQQWTQLYLALGGDPTHIPRLS